MLSLFSSSLHLLPLSPPASPLSLLYFSLPPFFLSLFYSSPPFFTFTPPFSLSLISLSPPLISPLFFSFSLSFPLPHPIPPLLSLFHLTLFSSHVLPHALFSLLFLLRTPPSISLSLSLPVSPVPPPFIHGSHSPPYPAYFLFSTLPPSVSSHFSPLGALHLSVSPPVFSSRVSRPVVSCSNRFICAGYYGIPIPAYRKRNAGSVISFALTSPPPIRTRPPR